MSTVLEKDSEPAVSLIGRFDGFIGKHPRGLKSAAIFVGGLWLGVFVTGAIMSYGHGYFDKTVTMNVYVTSIDDGADLAQYGNPAVGDPIAIKLSESDLNMFQVNNATGFSLCMGDLEIKPFISRADGFGSGCGSIHTVLFPPL